jgi:hypothetical protein
MRLALHVVLALAGCALVVVGVGQMFAPAAWIVAGVELLSIAYMVRYFDVRSLSDADS